jgi:hypothetical protein
MKRALIFITISLVFVVAMFTLFPFGAHIDGDTGYYFSMAVQITEENIFAVRETMAPIGYPLVLNLAKYLFSGDFLTGALFINIICFLFVLYFLIKEVTDNSKGYMSLIDRIYSVVLLFTILFIQYFNSRILFSAWPETLFIAFSVAGQYFIGRFIKNKSHLNYYAIYSLIFFVAAWYCKHVGIIGVAVLFLIFGLQSFRVKRSIWALIVRSAPLLAVLFALVTPAAIRNFLRSGNILGEMANPNSPQYVLLNFGNLDNYFNRVFEFFNNIFAHLLSSFYLIRYPDLLIGILLIVVGIAILWSFYVNFRFAKATKGQVESFFLKKNFQWYAWGTAYIFAMIIKLLSGGFSTQAMSRYASLLIPFVCFFMIDFVMMINSKRRRIVFPLLIALFTVLGIHSIYINLPDYSQIPKKFYINNYHNLRGYSDYRQIRKMLNEVEAIYFLPKKNNWPIADKFYALFPCKEFYVSRKWSREAYNEKIYPIPKFNTPFAVISDYEADEVLPFIAGKGEIVRRTTILGLSICLVNPYGRSLNESIQITDERSSYLGHGFISHGCR